MKVKLQKVQKGFTLIELMITVAIIGILSAIALPAYQDYVAKANVAAALAEITPGKTTFEVMVNEGKPDSDFTTAGIGLKTGVCTSITVDAGPDGSITCSVPVKGTATDITWQRDETSGGWSCVTAVDEKYAPKGCGPAAAPATPTP